MKATWLTFQLWISNLLELYVVFYTLYHFTIVSMLNLQLSLYISPLLPFRSPHLGPTHADDAVDVAVGIVKEGHGDGMFAGGDPVPFGAGVDLENMGPGAEDRLLPGGGGGSTEDEDEKSV